MRWLRNQARRAVQSFGDPAVVLSLGKRLGLGHGAPLYEPPPLDSMRRVLVLRLDGIGDLLMTSAFLRELRRNLPYAEITLVVKPASFSLVELCPYVNRVLAFQPSHSPRFGSLARHGQALALARSELWGKGYDTVIVPRWEVCHDHEPFLAYFSGIPRRVGYSERVSRYKQDAAAGTDLLFTHLSTASEVTHEVELSLNLLRWMGGSVEREHLEAWLSDADHARAEDLLHGWGWEPGDFLVAIAPGAALARRRWPVDRYLEVCRWLLETTPAKLMLVGGPLEDSLAAEFEKALPGRYFPAQREHLSIRESIALLARASLYLGNNTGPMHFAAVSGVPVIEVSCHPSSCPPQSENSPARFSAWKVHGAILQPTFPTSPCEDHCPADTAHCILGVTVDQVRTALQVFLSSRTTPHMDKARRAE